MSEVRPTNSASSTVTAAPAKTAGAGKVAGNLDPSGGKSLPVESQPVVQTVKSEPFEVQQAKLDEAVSRLNEYVQSTQRDLYFNYDESSNKTVVTVVDRYTDEVIRQIPNEVALQLADRLNDEEPVRLFSAQA